MCCLFFKTKGQHRITEDAFGCMKGYCFLIFSNYLDLIIP